MPVDIITKTNMEPSIEQDVISISKAQSLSLDIIPDSLKEMSEEEIEAFMKKTTRKIDMRMLPMLTLIYILNYLDRNNIASARLGGIEEDLRLKGTEYQTCISILFVGYILMQVPSNMLFNKLARPTIFISISMTIWGVISACTGAISSSHGFAGLLVIRILIGVIELAFFPSALFLLSKWYSAKELTFRTTILYSGSLLSGAFSGLIAAGIINNLDGARGLKSWRWLFIIEGCITIFIVPFSYLILPDMPHNTKGLSQQERDVIMYKMKRGVGQDDLDKAITEMSYKQIFISTIKDIKMWSITGTLSFLVAAAGVTNFFPTVVGTLGFDRIITLVLTAPPYLIAVVATYLWARHADITGERYYHTVAPLCVALISFIISAATLNTAARYFAMCIMIPSLYCSFTVILTHMSNTIPRPPVRRATAIAIMNALSNSTSIWNSYLYPAGDAPKFTTAFVCNCVFIGLAICCATYTRFRLVKLNKRVRSGTMNWEKEFGIGFDSSHIADDFQFLY